MPDSYIHLAIRSVARRMEETVLVRVFTRMMSVVIISVLTVTIAQGQISSSYVGSPTTLTPDTFNPRGTFMSSNETEVGDKSNFITDSSKKNHNNGYENSDTSTNPDAPGDLLSDMHKLSPGSRELLSPGSSVQDLPGADVPLAPVKSNKLGSGLERLMGTASKTEEKFSENGENLGERGGPNTAVPRTDTFLGESSGFTAEARAQRARITRGTEYENKKVVDVQILGNTRNKSERIMQFIQTRPERPFRAYVVEDDIRRLNQSGMFTLVESHLQASGDGVIVIYRVMERNILKYLRFQGNESIRVATLEKESGLKVGTAVSPYDVEDSRKRLENFYHAKGFAKVVINTVQGSKITDPGVIFLINEGPKMRVASTVFIGNHIATDARLRTIISSKPGILWLFQGELRDDALESDIKVLEDYYRRLGFFNARISRRVKQTSENGWCDVVFVIDEGPQYHISSIKFLGNKHFPESQLQEKMKITQGKSFNKDRLDQSIARVQRAYGREGYVFADIKAETRFLEQPGQCEVVFQIHEGKIYRVGEVNILISPEGTGEIPQTQISTVLNRLSVKPGDVVNLNQITSSERRLRASQLFAADPQQGKMPRVVYAPPNLREDEEKREEVALTKAPRTLEKGDLKGRTGSAGRDALSGAGSRSMPLSETVYRLAIPEKTPLKENEAYLEVNIHTQRTADGRMQVAENTPLELRDPVSGHIMRTFSEDGNTDYLQGRVSVLNEDPLYADDYISEPSLDGVPQLCMSPVLEGDGKRPGGSFTRTQQTSYYAGTSQRQVTETSHSENSIHATENPVYPNKSITTAVSSRGIPLEIIPTRTQNLRSSRQADSDVMLAQNMVEEKTVTRVQPVQGTAEEESPSWASLESANAAPEIQTAPINRQVGQGVAPPPQPGISNPDTTPFSQPVTDSPAPGYTYGDWQRWSLPISAEVEETTTGRVMVSLGVNTDSGLVGSVVVDEQNFDILRWPRSWREMGTAFRGAGQHFRIEAMPGTEVQRYAVSFDEPYLFNSEFGLGTSAAYYNRIYNQWSERRMGGQISLRHALTHDMSAYLGFRGYDINVYDPIIPSPERLERALGSSGLYGFSFRLVQDRRDNAFLATEGYYASMEFEQVIGTYVYPRINLQFKKYWMLHERADMSGRHVISFTSSLSWSGDDTPIYESYFAGGTTTIRGFEFRGAGPHENGVSVGGNFMLLASVEYLFPLTADDMLRGVLFCDTGTVEPFINDWTDKYRVAVGAGLRITVPFLGSAPIALDFAVPVVQNEWDQKQVFSMIMGMQR